jgi:hypothetical protein
MFIREYGDQIYIAEESRCGKLFWSVMPRTPTLGIGADVRIEARRVPMRVRKAIYNKRWQESLR